MPSTFIPESLSFLSNVDDPEIAARLRETSRRVYGASGQALFGEVARAVAETTGAETVLVGIRELRGAEIFVRTLAFWYNGQLGDNFEYPLAGTPCERVTGRDFRYYNADALAQFSCPPSSELGVKSYIGLPLVSRDDTTLGVIVAMSTQPSVKPVWAEAMLRLFADRTVSEIERHDASRALENAEEAYRVIFEANEDPIFVLDVETTRIVAVNQKACVVYGYTREEFAQVSPRDVSSGEPPFTEVEAFNWMAHARHTGFAEFEWHRRNRDGSLHWDEVRLKSVIIGGQPRILAFTREITERKAAESALRASEAMYRAVFNSSLDGLAVVSRDYTVIDANPAGCQISGYSREETIGRNMVRDFPLDEDYQSARREFFEAAFAQGFVRGEDRMKTKDGRLLHIELRAAAVENRDEQLALFFMRDVTQAKLQELELRASEARLRATIDAAIDCIVTLDGSGTILDANPATLRCFGMEPAAIKGRDCATLLFPAETRAAFREVLADAASTGATARCAEILGQHADGRPILLELTIGVSQGSRELILIAYLHDLTERRNAERARAELEAQLRQAQKMEALGQLTGGIAHDFNNILTSTIGYIDLVQELGKEIKSEHRRYLQRAKRAGKRAQDLVQQMLTYSRGGRGQPRPVEVTTLVTEVVSMLEATLPSSIQIEVEAETEVPRIFLDPVNATQALMNLCINARDAMAGHGVLRIQTEQRQFDSCRCSSCKQPVAGSYVLISVADTGAGIDNAILERIFEPFFSTKAQGNGSGMGLATTHGIVHQVGGHIVVDNRSAGTTFALLFPSARATGLEDTELQNFAPSSDTQTLRGNVLVVDDNPAVGEFMRDLLRSWGLNVTVQQSAIRAEQAFCAAPQAFDLAVIDQTMPERSGLELSRGLQTRQPDFPIVLYTGFSDTVDEDIARKAGCIALLRKPVDAVRLKTIVRGILEKVSPA